MSNSSSSSVKALGSVPVQRAFHLAWRQLQYDKVRFITATLGVIFACVLVFMQIGFKNALFESATLLQRTMTGDIYMIEDQSEALWRLVPFPRRYLYKALSVEGVEDVTALYASQTPWKNPMTGVNRTALVLGIDPRSTVYNLPGLREVQEKLHMHDAVLFDEYSRPEFGPVKDMVEKNGVFSAEIGGKQLDVVDTFRMGITFSADGNIIVKDTTFFKIFPNKSADGIDVGIVSLQKGADIETAKNKIRSLLPENILVLNREEYIEEEKAYWNDITPIGYIFNFGVIMGLIVGFVIVYQVLFNDINNHLHEYATLKAIGYDDYYFTKVVISASIILAVGGYIPGFLICAVLYKIVESSIFIEMDLNFIKAITTFVLISSMCFLSGLLAIRKLKSANPVDVFQ